MWFKSGLLIVNSIFISSLSTNSRVLSSNLSQMTCRNTDITYVNAEISKAIDETLMTTNPGGFSIDQLMELAGLSVAYSVDDYYKVIYPETTVNNKSIGVFCGPGNNGGDGLVAARHLKHFGYNPIVVYPKQSKGILFSNLVQQMIDLEIPVLKENEYEATPENLSQFNFIIDSLFGFSFLGPAKEPFASIIDSFTKTSIPILSVDIPSGWNVNEGDIYHSNFTPSAVISLTAPKLCMKGFTGTHYVGGRFVPKKIAELYHLNLVQYTGTNQV